MFDAAIAAAVEDAPHEAAPVPVVTGLEVHVDGDYLAYFASGNDETSPGTARLNAISLIQNFMACCGAEKAVVHNTAKGCHKGERYLIATVKAYQDQRVDSRKPKNHAYLQDWLQTYDGDLFRVKNWTTREADDGIGACAAFAASKAPGYIAIATADKDLRMLPGLHITWKLYDGRRILTRVHPGDYDVVGADGKQYGLKWFFEQMLTGDNADNIPGLPEHRSTNAKGQEVYKKVGPATAQKLLADCSNVAEATRLITDLYYENYHRDSTWAERPLKLQNTEYADRLAEQAALLWMRVDLHGEVDDFAKKLPWEPVILAAAHRMKERVTLERAKINSLSDIVDPLCAVSLAA